MAYALPAFALPPDGTRPPPPEIFDLPRIVTLPGPGTRSPLDSVTISPFVRPPPAGATGSAGPLFPLTIGGARPSYIVDLDSRFDAPPVRELPQE